MDFSPPTLSPTAQHTLQCLKPLFGLTSLMLVGCLALYFGLVVPTETRKAEILSTLNHLQQQHVHRQTAKNTQAQLAKLWKTLPAPREFSDLGVTITQLAQANNVRIPSMEYHQEKKKDGLAAKGSISFEAFGEYESIRKFIYELETSGTYLIIEKLTAERTKKHQDVAFKMQIGTYFRPETALIIPES